MKVIGIDYGTKRIGIAVSDDEGTMAFPRTVLKNNGAVAVIARLAEEEGADRIVVGVSLNAEGEENKVMGDIHPFVERLKDISGIPVSFESEQFTSMHAGNNYLPGEHRGSISRVRGERGNASLDASAAALILQRYLDRLRRQGPQTL